MEIVLTLPLPHRGLRPNSMLRWQAKFGLTKQARERAKRAMFEAARQIEAEVWLIKGFSVRAYFRTKRHWDINAVESSMKAIEDGIADTARQDDSTFEHYGVERFTDTKNPRLEIILTIQEVV